MRIGNLTVETPVILAPMAAVTDLPFRTVCEEFGVGFTITEFLSAHALANGDTKTAGKMTASLGGRKFGVQIFGREEEPMAIAARMAVSIGASLVDINMGCPAKRVVAVAARRLERRPHRDEPPAPPRRQLVQQARDQLAAGAVLAAHQRRAVGVGDALEVRDRGAHGGALRDQGVAGGGVGPHQAASCPAAPSISARRRSTSACSDRARWNKASTSSR